ncbi:MAG: hypothetical protein WCI02_17310 [Planctomycetota bacterium]
MLFQHILRFLRTTLLDPPVRALSELSEWFGSSARASMQDSEDDETPLGWKRILLSPFRQLGFFGSSLAGAFAAPNTDSTSLRRWRLRLIASAPAWIAVGTTMLLVCNAWVSSPSIESRYFTRFESAIREGSTEAAKDLGSHLIRYGTKASPEASFEFCKLLAEERELDRANAIIEVLAPNDSPGYPPAHEQRAIAYSNIMSVATSTEILKNLRWHLDQAGERNNESLLLAWATYHRSNSNWIKCVQALEAAALLNPAHIFPAIEISLRQGNTNNAERLLRYGLKAYETRLAKNTLSIDDRIQLARVQARLGSAEEAERTLKAGLDLFPDNKDLQQTMAALELARYDKATSNKRSVEDRIDQLLKAASAAENSAVVFDRMVQIYRESDNPEHRARVRQFLEESLRRNEDSAVTHFVLSIIAVLENQYELSIKYLERSLELSPNQHLVQNNLAWLLSKRSPPELDRALMLSQSAVELAPNIVTYHDTLGSIFLLRKDYQSAVTELERALNGLPANTQAGVHQKLAQAYEALGNEALAAMHAKRFEELAAANAKRVEE